MLRSSLRPLHSLKRTPSNSSGHQLASLARVASARIVELERQVEALNGTIIALHGQLASARRPAAPSPWPWIALGATALAYLFSL